jgi:hypothetical protein
MDPHVYPDPQTAPLNLGPGATSAAISIEQLTAPSLVPPNDNFMYIRIGISDPAGALGAIANQPDVVLQADAGPPSPVLTPNTQTVFSGATYIADASIARDPAANNVFIITIDFFPPAFKVHTWTITIKNKDAAARDFTWVVSGTEANTAQPWIDVEPTALAWDVLIKGTQSESVQITNRGTAPFTVNSVNPALPGSFTLGPLPPGSLNPGDSPPLTVTFTAPATPPMPDGRTTANANVSITPLDVNAGTTVGHNQQLSVAARTQALEIVMLLDDSGSMTWLPDGTPLPLPPPPQPTSRWGELVDAVNNNFLPLLLGFGKDRGNFSVARFPETDSSNPTTFDLINPPINIDATGIGNAQTAISGVTPFFAGTPMGDGINRVFAQPPTYFATDSVSMQANRRWLLLMTDGAQNIGTHQPTEYILPAFGGTAAVGTSIADKNISLFAIGYGITGHSNVNPTLLANLVAGSLQSGQPQNKRADDNGLTGTQIASAFRDAIKAGITHTSSPNDPSAVFNAGQPEARHFALITKYDNRAAFVLAWNTPDPRRMRLELITPTCDVITPETAAKGVFPDVSFLGGNRSQLYMIGPDFLRNAADPAHPRYGTWTLRVLSPELSDSEAGLENYDHDVIVDSDLSLQLRLDQPVYYAGDPIQISARLTAAGRPIKGAGVVLSTTAPQQSEANWLAGLNVPADALKRAADQVKGDSTPLLIKTVGAGLAGMTFPGGKTQSNTAMIDAGGIGTYRATITNTSTPEMHTFYVTAVGVTEDGSSFRREGKMSTNVLVRPDSVYTRLDVQFGASGTAQVVVIPRDRFGNVLLVDPATTPGFVLTVKAGNFTTPLNSNLDGTYTQLLKFASGATPVIGVSFNGKTIQQQTLPPVANLKWVDKVEAFVLGAEAAKGANLHRDSKAALGDIHTKPPGVFVSLGALGSLTVAVQGQSILAQGHDDITVFVQPDDDLRAYLVEVLPAKDDAIWVALGTSPGTTSSFSLKKAGLSSASAVRISDKSGRTRDGQFKPLAMPGVSIRGVGVKSTGEDDEGTGEGDVCIRLRVLDPKRQPLGGTVDLEFQPKQVGETLTVKGVSSSKDIDVKGLQRTPQGLYEVTVTPTGVFKPTSQFVTIPASGFVTVEFIINKRRRED